MLGKALPTLLQIGCIVADGRRARFLWANIKTSDLSLCVRLETGDYLVSFACNTKMCVVMNMI